MARQDGAAAACYLERKTEQAQLVFAIPGYELWVAWSDMYRRTVIRILVVGLISEPGWNSGVINGPSMYEVRGLRRQASIIRCQVTGCTE